MSKMDNMKIAPRYTTEGGWYTVRDWKNLNIKDSQNTDWETAVDIFHSRILSRFIEPADILLKSRGKAVGFAVLSLDFIVIETIQGFIEGKLDRDDSSGPFKRFLTSAIEFREVIRSEGFAGCVYGAFRCGISHQGQTDGNFRVLTTGEMVQKISAGPRPDIAINRTLFHKAVKEAFERYCKELREGKKAVLRKKFFTKMNAVCGVGAA